MKRYAMNSCGARGGCALFAPLAAATVAGVAPVQAVALGDRTLGVGGQTNQFNLDFHTVRTGLTFKF